MLQKIMMFAASIASRGWNNKTVDLPVKQLRVLSCYGDKKEIGACPYLRKSKHSQYYYCGGCGCGDKKNTWLMRGPNEYSKLDYPVLNCPMKMPGFTNYDPNHSNNVIKDHKEKVENYDLNNLQYIQVTVNRNQENEKIFDEVKKIIKNS